MKTILLFVSMTITFLQTGSARECFGNSDTDLTNGLYFENGTVLKDEVYFPPNSVFVKNVSGINVTFGCLCEVKTCIRKCCGMKEMVFGDNENIPFSCMENGSFTSVFQNGLKLYDKVLLRRTADVFDDDKIAIIDDVLSCVSIITDNNKYLQQDGSLYVSMPLLVPPYALLPPDKYCIDTFVSDFQDPGSGHLDALVCFGDNGGGAELSYYVAAPCMLISCALIIVTVAVYTFVPELRNLHGKVLVAYLSCQFVAFLSLAITQLTMVTDAISANACTVSAFVIYFSFQTAFFWMSVMSFDIWWTFSGKRGVSRRKLSDRNRFMTYSVCAFSVPALLTMVLAALEFSNLEPHLLLPMIRLQGYCFLYGPSKFLYFYGPMLLMCVFNMLFFVLTAVQIVNTTKQTCVLKSKDSNTSKKFNSNKERFILYLKLFLLMGISWIMEIVSNIFPEPRYIWYVVDVYNLLIGAVIFVMFVCKRKIIKLIRKRATQLKRETISSTQSTSMSRSSRDGKVEMEKTKRSLS